MIELYHGDALHVMEGLESGSFDAIVTDPPYASGGASTAERLKSTAYKYTSSSGTKTRITNFEGDAMDQITWAGWMTEVLIAARRLAKEGALLLIFVDWRQYSALSTIVQRTGWVWRGTVVWDKGNSRPQMGRYKQQCEFILWASNGGVRTDASRVYPGLFHYQNVSGRKRIHQTQKPEELMIDLLRPIPAGGRILDPFAGSGSTLQAANTLGLNAVGVEISSTIAQAAADRLHVALHSAGGRWAI